MAAKIQIEISAQDARALQAYQKLSNEEKKLLRNMGETDKKSAKWGATLSKVKGVAFSIAGVLGMSGGVAMGLGAIVRVTKEWKENLDAAGRAVARASDNLATFLMLQAKGTERAQLQRATQMGAVAGMKPGEAVAQYQALQSAYGTAQAPQAMRAMTSLIRGGASPEAAKETVRVLRGGGTPWQRIAPQAYRAGELSMRDPGFMAEHLPRAAGGGAAGAETLAAQVLMTRAKDIPATEVGTYTRRGLIGMWEDTPQKKRFWQKLGASGRSRGEKLRALKAAGLTDPEALGRAGMKGKLVGRVGLAALARGADDYGDVLGEIRGAAPGVVEEKLGRAEAAVPAVGWTRAERMAGAEAERMRTLSPEAARAQRAKTARRLRAAIMIQRGAGWAVGEEEGAPSVGGGMPSPFSARYWSGSYGARWGRGGQAWSPSLGRQPGEAYGGTAIIERLLKTLETEGGENANEVLIRETRGILENTRTAVEGSQLRDNPSPSER